MSVIGLRVIQTIKSAVQSLIFTLIILPTVCCIIVEWWALRCIHELVS